MNKLLNFKEAVDNKRELRTERGILWRDLHGLLNRIDKMGDQEKVKQVRTLLNSCVDILRK